jgi:short-subunit dehydrogenase
MVRQLKDRRILVTGASGGIGRAIAETAARRSARVVVSARSADKLETLVGDLKSRGCDALAVPADVTREEDRKRLLETIVAQWGGLDVLINNAGVASFGHFATSSEEVLRTIMEVNFFAPAELMRLAIPVLQKGFQPAILNLASMCGRRGMPAWPEYSASKFALCGMTEALRGEMARFDIDVLLVLPGLTRSDLNRHLLRNDGKMDIPFDKGMPPAEVAEGVITALEKNRTETVLGSEAKRMLLLQKFTPRLLDRLIARRVKKLYESA